MTNTTCTDCHRRLTSANTKVSGQHDLCDDCFDLAGLEASHQDGDHDGVDDEGHSNFNADCLMCDPNARADRSKSVKLRITPHTKRSHAACYEAGAHDKTREGRAGCRALGGPGSTPDA
jgi:hypothetical protein